MSEEIRILLERAFNALVEEGYSKETMNHCPACKLMRDIDAALSAMQPAEPPLPWLAIDLAAASNVLSLVEVNLIGTVATLTAQLSEARGLLERASDALEYVLNAEDWDGDAVATVANAVQVHLFTRSPAPPDPRDNHIRLLKAALRLTALRWVPGITHEQIDAHIEAILRGEAVPMGKAVESAGDVTPGLRERIARELEYEADLLPCKEDAQCYQAAAKLVRAKFSHAEAFDDEPPEAAPAGDTVTIHFRSPHGTQPPTDCCGCWNLVCQQSTQAAYWECNECGARAGVMPPPEPDAVGDVVRVEWVWRQDYFAKSGRWQPGLDLFAGTVWAGRITYKASTAMFCVLFEDWACHHEFDTLSAAKSAS